MPELLPTSPPVDAPTVAAVGAGAARDQPVPDTLPTAKLSLIKPNVLLPAKPPVPAPPPLTLPDAKLWKIAPLVLLPTSPPVPAAKLITLPVA